MDKEKIGSIDNMDKGAQKRSLIEGHWFSVAENIFKDLGEKPDKFSVMAVRFLDKVGIPFGEWSALSDDREKDKIIAEMLTNKSGRFISEISYTILPDFLKSIIRKIILRKEPQEIIKEKLVSPSIDDILLEGRLPEELKHSLGEKTADAIEWYLKMIKENFPVEPNPNAYIFGMDIIGGVTRYYNTPAAYFRFPKDVDLLMIAYEHIPAWHDKKAKYLREINKNASVIVIEGAADIKYEDKLKNIWNSSKGHFDELMREAIESGFNGYFAVVDARDTSNIDIDYNYDMFGNVESGRNPNEFYKALFDFIKNHDKAFAENVKSYKDLKNIMTRQAINYVYQNKVKLETKELDIAYHVGEDKESIYPTFLEVGRFAFSDALSAIKLHILAKLMQLGKLPKGLIVDYRGSGHFYNTQFFVRYPYYAMIVVLRNAHELMAGKVKSIEEIIEFLKDPNYEDMFKEIVRVSVGKVVNGEIEVKEFGWKDITGDIKIEDITKIKD